MKTGKGVYLTRRAIILLVIVSAAALLLGLLPPGPGGEAAGAAEPAFTPATFDMFSMFPLQHLSPSTGRTLTWMPVETRNIADVSGWIWLSARSESPYFNALALPPLVRPSGAQGRAKCWVLVTCSPSTPEGTTGYIKVTGIRGGEQHRVWLKVVALSSQPALSKSAGVALLGKGYHDPDLQAYTGEPLTWEFEASNNGGAQDTYDLSWEADFACQVRFTMGANEISEVTVGGLARNYIFATPAYFNVEVVPTENLPKNHPMDVTVRLGPGNLTASTSEVTVQVVNPGMLYCANDLDGMRPHAHQVMAGETTSFMFHVTNLGASAADIGLSQSEDEGGWSVALDRDMIAGLEPGHTEQAILAVTPPASAGVGDRIDLAVTANSSLGAAEESAIAAEVTDVRNVYFFAIDSMDPEYLHLNRAGTGPGSEGDWLMPNVRSFMGDGVTYSDARVYLPSATDMDHTNALAGSYTGTQGLFSVGGTVVGYTEYDELITAPNSMDLMLHGPEGKPIERIYEVAEEETEGKALAGFWSNKNWLADVEGERTVEIVGHSERFPLFFPPPYKYVAAGDPQTDENPADPLSGPFSMLIYTENTSEILVPALIGQFNLILGLNLSLGLTVGINTVPLSLMTGTMPGTHCEDRYLVDSFLRSILEEDPDVCYINAADLDNTGHFTGSSWSYDEWDTKGTPSPLDDESVFSPWMRRDECLDICREADVLFADFIQLLKDRGAYDNSVIVFLSDHGMENMKDQESGYELLDLREILRRHGLVFNEDYREAGGTEINFLWCDDADRLQAIEEILEGYTVDDPELGPVQPLIVINREEMASGVDYGEHGHVRPMELYSEYWINHPGEQGGHLWPELFVFPLYNYNVAMHGAVLTTAVNPVGASMGNVPDNLQIGLPAAHGGLQTAYIPLIFKAPVGSSYAPGTVIEEEVEVGDIAPTIYGILGWEVPDCVDGAPLPY